MNNDNLARFCRGGSWNFDARSVQVADRNWYGPSVRYDSLGFRLSRVINPLEQLSEVLNEKG